MAVHNFGIAKLLKTYISPYISKAFSDKYLLLTNVGISITLSGLGDILEQRYEIMTDKLNCWDKIRTRNMALSGTTVGIVCHFWYKHLDAIVPGNSLRIVIKKVVIDQMIGSPLCISTFMGTIGLLERYSKEEFVKQVKEKAWRLYIAEWMIWPPAQFINFYVLPTKYRVLFDNTVSLGYDIYTSHVMHCVNEGAQKS